VGNGKNGKGITMEMKIGSVLLLGIGIDIKELATEEKVKRFDAITGIPKVVTVINRVWIAYYKDQEILRNSNKEQLYKELTCPSPFPDKWDDSFDFNLGIESSRILVGMALAETSIRNSCFGLLNNNFSDESLKIKRIFQKAGIKDPVLQLFLCLVYC
jgi:hypothetical protein